MRHPSIHRPVTSPEPELPEAASVYQAAVEKLTREHEHEAASLLARCSLEIVATGSVHSVGEQLHPVRLVVTGPGDAVAELEQNAEVRGRVRQALDSALGPTIYLAQMAVSARSGVRAA